MCVHPPHVYANKQFNEAGDRMEPFNLKTERTEGYFDETVRASFSFLFFFF